jgi:hypothetical protein
MERDGDPPPRERERGLIMSVVHSGEGRGTPVGCHIVANRPLEASFHPYFILFPALLAIVILRALRHLIQCCPK